VPGHELRWQSAHALGAIGDGRAAPALLHALGDPDMFVVSEATKALREIGRAAIPALVTGLSDPTPDVRQIAEQTLGQIDPAWPRTLEAQTAAPQLMQYLKILGGDDELRVYLEDLIRRIDPNLLDLQPQRKAAPDPAAPVPPSAEPAGGGSAPDLPVPLPTTAEAPRAASQGPADASPTDGPNQLGH